MARLSTKRVAVITMLVTLTVLSIRTEVPYSKTAYPRKLDSDKPKLRVLNFGTSVSWGAGLDSRFEAYPYLVDRNATNLAIRASGPFYPSVCTETMVGNHDVYDVITLEFFTRSSQGLLRLAKRLRNRFPYATIIVIRRWNPLVYKHVPSNEDFQTWMENHGYQDADDKSFDLSDADFHMELFDMTMPDDWIFNVDEAELMAQEEAVKAVGGYLLELPRPLDFRKAIANTHGLFAPDMNHLSQKGHKYIASQIQNIVRNVKATRSSELGSWGGHDYCESWFLSGSSTDLHMSDSVKMVQFDEKNSKWALELQGENWITVVNPFDKPQLLLLSYMVTGPPPSIYPQTFVYTEETSALLDPVVTNPGPKEHVVQTSVVGEIPPGETRLNFRVLEEDVKEKPFRITGYAIVGLEVDNLDFLSAYRS